MKVGDYFIKESVPQKIANAKGKFSNQFINSDKLFEKSSSKSSRKMFVEEGFKIKGYDINVRRPSTSLGDQPMAGHSEFWIG